MSFPVSAPRVGRSDVCVICASHRLYYVFSVAGKRVVRCHDCGLLKVDQAAVSLRESPAAPEPVLGATAPAAPALAAFARYQHGRTTAGSRDMLIVAASESPLADAARSAGWHVSIAHPSALASLPAAQHDVVALDTALNHAGDPRQLLADARRVLRPDGAAIAATPPLRAWSGRAKPGKASVPIPADRANGRAYFFNTDNLQSLFFAAGFRSLIVRPLDGGDQLAPAPDDGGVLFARLAALRQQPVLSLVVPIYNEAATVAPCLDQLLAKRVEGLEIETVIIESNSTDGTREIVQRYANRPGVKLVLEDRPRGKGRAVREGLRHATGDFVLIQDADLEYDLEEYEVLLEPLVAGRASFVLGARHGGQTWKIRQFTDEPLKGAVLNSAHWVFTWMLNRALGLRMNDPFTMYKVFRRDCLHGLTFHCNRFDFDWELLIKLVRKGYRPIEIPVNYRSRSFNEGKKVTLFRDPLTWLVALVRARREKIDLLSGGDRLS